MYEGILAFILRELKKLQVVEKGCSHRKKDALWDRLTALLRIVNETIEYCNSQYGQNLVSLWT